MTTHVFFSYLLLHSDVFTRESRVSESWCIWTEF